MNRLLVPAAVAVLLTGCSTGTGADDPTVALPPTATATSGPAPSSGGPTPHGTVIEVSYAVGEVTGVQPRVEVPLGEQVVLRVTSDVVEQIHVHGYDEYLDLVPGTRGELVFTADLPGAYEVELHEAGRPLFQLRVA